MILCFGYTVCFFVFRRLNTFSFDSTLKQQSRKVGEKISSETKLKDKDLDLAGGC